MRSVAKDFLDSVFSPIGKEAMSKSVEKLAQSPELFKNRIAKSSTTVFTFKYGDGVVIAGDRRTVGDWYGLISDASVKVKQLSPSLAIACSGYCSVINYIEKNMESICSKFINSFGKELSPDGAANFLRNLLEEWFSMLLYLDYWAISAPILAGYDNVTNQPRIFEFSEDGYFYEPPIVAGTGCGYDAVKFIIIDECMKTNSMTEKDAVALALRAMFHSGSSSAGVSDVRLALPSVALIDKDGFRWISEDKLKITKSEVLSNLGVGNA